MPRRPPPHDPSSPSDSPDSPAGPPGSSPTPADSSPRSPGSPPGSPSQPEAGSSPGSGPTALLRALARPDSSPTGWVRSAARVLLGGALATAGVGHLTVAREEFQAQVPSWVPLDADLVVLASGVVEVVLGAALATRPRHRVLLGWTTAAFFVAIFPGNVAQYVEGVDGFGLDTDRARLARLFFQPVLVAWSLWSTAAWRDRLRP
jgi:uncharacterized membrane protein